MNVSCRNCLTLYVPSIRALPNLNSGVTNKKGNFPSNEIPHLYLRKSQTIWVDAFRSLRSELDHNDYVLRDFFSLSFSIRDNARSIDSTHSLLSKASICTWLLFTIFASIRQKLVIINISQKQRKKWKDFIN